MSNIPQEKKLEWQNINVKHSILGSMPSEDFMAIYGQRNTKDKCLELGRVIRKGFDEKDNTDNKVLFSLFESLCSNK